MNDSMRRLEQYERMVRGFARRNRTDAALDTLAVVLEVCIACNLIAYLTLASSC